MKSNTKLKEIKIRILIGEDMKYVATIRIPTMKPNKNGTVFSKECALKQLEDMKKQYNVIWSEWIAGDLVVEFEVDI